MASGRASSFGQGATKSAAKLFHLGHSVYQLLELSILGTNVDNRVSQQLMEPMTGTRLENPNFVEFLLSGFFNGLQVSSRRNRSIERTAVNHPLRRKARPVFLFGRPAGWILVRRCAIQTQTLRGVYFRGYGLGGRHERAIPVCQRSVAAGLFR